jgi:hypothetical protein
MRLYRSAWERHFKGRADTAALTIPMGCEDFNERILTWATKSIIMRAFVNFPLNSLRFHVPHLFGLLGKELVYDAVTGTAPRGGKAFGSSV